MDSQPRVWPPLLDWHDRGTHWDEIAYPCVICRRPTHLVSAKGKPTHKVCAEEWYEKHPEHWLRYEAERDKKAREARAGQKALAVDDEPETLF